MCGWDVEVDSLHEQAGEMQFPRFEEQISRIDVDHDIIARCMLNTEPTYITMIIDRNNLVKYAQSKLSIAPGGEIVGSKTVVKGMQSLLSMSPISWHCSVGPIFFPSPSRSYH